MVSKKVLELRERERLGERLNVKELRKLERWKWTEEGLLSSVRSHVGKWMDSGGPTEVLKTLGENGKEVLGSAAVAYLGWKWGSERAAKPEDMLSVIHAGIEGVLTASFGYALATGDNEAGAIAGVALLTSIGITIVGQGVLGELGADLPFPFNQIFSPTFLLPFNFGPA